MNHPKGAFAPFFYPVCSPRTRGDALLSSAADAFEAGRHGDALVATEYVCRRFPSRSLPAMLRARILHTSRPELAAEAWYGAWKRDPEHPAIQDQLLAAWLASGAAASVAELGPCFLPARCSAGTHASLVALLARAGLTHVGACWKQGAAIEMMLFFPSAADGKPPMARLRLTGVGASHVYEVPADGRRLRLPPVALDTTWSLTVERPGQAPAMLHGSPLVFAAAPQPPAPAAADPGQVSIVIPVYRQRALVQTCIESVLASLAHNRTPAELVVVDDASPEPDLSAWLDRQAAAGRITLLRNPVNLGFIEAVNRGLRAHPGHDALLLNADTEVHGDWIDRLRASLYSAPDIASVTPWSNNGEISSFPAIARNALAPTSAQLAAIDAAAAEVRRADAGAADIELPTCCGFAMLMRRSVIASIGVLDGVALVRGYGEEVDWCLRARAAGWRHLLATGVFVAHTGTVSFRHEKTLRVRQNRHVLAERYPTYRNEYAAFLADDPLAAARAGLKAALAGEANDWLQAAQGALDPAADDDAMPKALPVARARVAVWRLRAGAAACAQVLELARLAAALPGQPLRLLVLGDVGEPLWRTGVVDGVPVADPEDDAPFSDAALVGMAGCSALLAADATGAPLDLPLTHLDRDFCARAWLDAWCAAHAIPLDDRQ
ncbi:glycosyltransferase family 2 protein [Telluria beijingensis]|uniref:glycosyltransferase family 2 protein n=1 Tax=Telluria beijingensis TaxID=3068633 RepID=UPI0027954410|nr:glycosyltransferase family 2 protein [Massilia sp. REN29]